MLIRVQEQKSELTDLQQSLDTIKNQRNFYELTLGKIYQVWSQVSESFENN
jgi:hypothetical protein